MITRKTESITTKTTLAILIVTMALALDRVSLAGDFVVTDRPAVRGFVVTDKWKPKEKPVVDFYSATWCGVCVVPDKELAKDPSSLPFRIRKVDVDTTPLSTVDIVATVAADADGESGLLAVSTEAQRRRRRPGPQ